MNQKFSYWQVEQHESNQNMIVKLKTVDDLAEKIELFTKDIEEKNKLIVKKKKEQREKKDSTEYTVLANEIIMLESDRRKAEGNRGKALENEKIQRINQSVSFKVERIKDIHSRKEALRVTILYKGKEDAAIVGTVNKIEDDIHKLDEYGIFLTPPYYDELAKTIREGYYDLEAKNQPYIENDVPRMAVDKFAYLCWCNIWSVDETGRMGKLDENVSRDSNEQYYYINTSAFKRWHEDSEFRGISIKSLKEALSLNQLIKCNSGRTDYNVANKGKVICFYAGELDKLAGKMREKNE